MPVNRRDFLVQTLGTLTGLALGPECSTVTVAMEGPPRKLAVIGVDRQGRAILTELACTAEEGARASIVDILVNQAITTGTTVEVPAFV